MARYYGYRGMYHDGGGEWDWGAFSIEIVYHEVIASLEKMTVESVNHGHSEKEREYSRNVRKYCGIPDHVGITTTFTQDGNKVVGLCRLLPAGTVMRIDEDGYLLVAKESLDPLEVPGSTAGNKEPAGEEWMGKAPESYF